MGGVVCGHHVYKLVWLPVIDKQLILEEPANSHNEFVVSVIKDSQIVGHIPKNYSQITCMVFYYTKGFHRLKYHVNIFIIVDPQKTCHLFESQYLFFVIMLFSLASK